MTAMLTNPHAEALAKLRDIHLPPQIGGWPFAPGWYFLILFFVGMVFTCLFLVYKHHLNGRAKRRALHLLASYQKQHQHDADSQLATARLSELLKRVALVYFPRNQVASLKGEEWINFLNSTANGINFQSVRKELLEMPYQPLHGRDLEQLFRLTKAWINQRSGPCSN